MAIGAGWGFPNGALWGERRLGLAIGVTRLDCLPPDRVPSPICYVTWEAHSAVNTCLNILCIQWLLATFVEDAALLLGTVTSTRSNQIAELWDH